MQKTSFSTVCIISVFKTQRLHSVYSEDMRYSPRSKRSLIVCPRSKYFMSKRWQCESSVYLDLWLIPVEFLLLLLFYCLSKYDDNTINNNSLQHNPAWAKKLRTFLHPNLLKAFLFTPSLENTHILQWMSEI